MNLAEQLRVLEAAQGDPAKLALATVDLAYPALSDLEHAQLKEALEAAAIPHWCDEAILAGLLEIPIAEAATQLARLRGLSVVEAFSARGEGAVNVHEAACLALRRQLAAEQPERFQVLSRRARRFFFTAETHPHRSEAVLQQTATASSDESDLIDFSNLESNRNGRFKVARALEAVFGKLRRFPRLARLAHAIAIANEMVGWNRHRQLSRNRRCKGVFLDQGELLLETVRPLRNDLRSDDDVALVERRKSKIIWMPPPVRQERLANIRWRSDAAVSADWLGALDAAQGRLVEVRRAFAERLKAVHRLADGGPANTECERDAAVSLDWLANLDTAQKQSEEARRAFTEGLEIAHRLAHSDLANPTWQRGVSFFRDRSGGLVNRKFNASAAWQRFKYLYKGPVGDNPTLVKMLATGGIRGLRPLHRERRIARRRFIVLLLILLSILWRIAYIYLRKSE